MYLNMKTIILIEVLILVIVAKFEMDKAKGVVLEENMFICTLSFQITLSHICKK